MPEILANVDNPETYPKISPSELRALMRCKKQHDYAYRQGLQQKNPPSYFSKGNYLHKLMEAWLLFQQWGAEEQEIDWPAVLPAMKLEVRHDLEEERGITLDASTREEVDKVFDQFIKDADMGNVEVLAVEQEFYVDLGLTDLVGESPVLLHGIIDVVLRERETGNLWISDHKTASRRWSQGAFMMDYQTPLYAVAWEKLTGEQPIGSLFNFFFPKDTDQHTFYWTDTQAANWVAELQQAILMRDYGFTNREPHWGCNDCSFRNLCHAELIGANSEYIRETEYTVNEEKAARFQEVGDG